MNIKNISITNNEQGHTFKKYEVSFNKKSDLIYYSCNEWGINFEPYAGNFSDKEFEEIKKALFDDAYYNKNFSKYN